MKFIQRLPTIDAFQWFQVSEHSPVGRFGLPDVPGLTVCIDCSRIMLDHGYIMTADGAVPVCPGDFIITHAGGQISKMDPKAFRLNYQPEYEGATT